MRCPVTDGTFDCLSRFQAPVIPRPFPLRRCHGVENGDRKNQQLSRRFYVIEAKIDLRFFFDLPRSTVDDRTKKSFL